MGSGRGNLSPEDRQTTTSNQAAQVPVMAICTTHGNVRAVMGNCAVAWERGIGLASRLVVLCDMMELSGNVRVVRKGRGASREPAGLGRPR